MQFRCSTLIALLCWTTSGCETLPDTTYGGTKVPVDIAVTTPSRSESASGLDSGIAPASAPSANAPDVDAWILNLVLWSEIDGRSRIAAYERLRSSGDPQAGERLADLVLEFDQNAERLQAVQQVQLPMELHYLVARFRDRLRFKEFNSTSDRRVTLVFPQTENVP